MEFSRDDLMKELFKLIRSDYHRYTGKVGGIKDVIFYLLFKRNHCFNYSFWFRLASRKNILFPLAVLMHKHLTTKYGIQIFIDEKPIGGCTDFEALMKEKFGVVA